MRDGRCFPTVIYRSKGRDVYPSGVMAYLKEDSDPPLVGEVHSNNVLHLDLDQSKHTSDATSDSQCNGTSDPPPQEISSCGSTIGPDLGCEPLQNKSTGTCSTCSKEDMGLKREFSSNVKEESKTKYHDQSIGRSSHSGPMEMYPHGSYVFHTSTCSLSTLEPDVQSPVARSVDTTNASHDDPFKCVCSSDIHEDDFEEVLTSYRCHCGKSNISPGPPKQNEEKPRACPDEMSGPVKLQEPETNNSVSNVEVCVHLKDVNEAWGTTPDKPYELRRISRNEAKEGSDKQGKGDGVDPDESGMIDVMKDSATETATVNPEVQSTEICCRAMLIHPDDVQSDSCLNSEEELTASKPSEERDAQSATPESQSFVFFDELPHELFFKILGYFSVSELCLTVAPVCKDWYGYSKSPVLWQHLDLSEHREVSHNQLCGLLGRVDLLKSLSLRGREQLALSELQMLSGCPLLTSLNLGFCDNVNGRVLDEIARCCPHLEILNMEGCERIDNDMASQFPSLPRLKVLNLSHCTKMTDDGVMLISRGCLLLEELNVDGIPWITDRAVDVLASQRTQTLRAIYLDGAELTDASIGYLVCCPHLHTLSLSFCEQLTDNALSMLQMINHLRHLRLKRGLEFSEEALCRFFEHCNVDDLTFLDLSECSELMDKGIASIAHQCPRLRKLALCWCWNVSDVGIDEIVLHCSQLRHLDIVGLDKVKGQCLSTIPEALPRLTLLDLRQCNMINDRMLVDLVTVKPHLCIFNYYGEQVTSDMIL